MEHDDLKFKLRRSDDKKELYGMTAIWLLGLVVLLALNLYFCMSAKAGGFGEVGVSRFIRPAEFIWWQGPYPHEFRTDSKYFRLGYEGEPQKVMWGSVAWRVSGFNLGNYSTSALATSDEAHLAEGRCNVHTCAPPDYYETRGSVRGLLFSGVYRKSWFFAEGGASITRQKFYLARLVLRSDFIGKNDDWYQFFTGSHTAIGYMASVGVEHKGFAFSFAYWLNGKASEFYAAGNTPGIDTVKTFAVGYRF